MSKHKIDPQKKSKGQALVETALVLPLFLLLVFGILEFGRAFAISQALYRTANTAARQAAMVDLSQATAAAQNSVNASMATYPWIQLAAGSPLITLPGDPQTEPIRVRLEAAFTSRALQGVLQLMGMRIPMPNLGSEARAFSAVMHTARMAPRPIPQPSGTPGPTPSPSPSPTPSPSPSPTPSPSPSPTPSPDDDNPS